MRDYAYLIQVDGLNNHNKFYEMIENEDGSIDVRYGRVGNNGVNKHYARYEKNFYDLRNSKLNKGYKDVTALHSKVESKQVEEYKDYKPSEDKNVDELIAFLYKSSREFMQLNYTVGKAEITEKMIKEAEHDLRTLNLCNNMSVYQFNEVLKELFNDIPRKMNHVSDYLAKTSADFAKIITRETEMLDNVKGQILTLSKTDDSKEAKDITYLESVGLSVKRPTYKEEDKIIANLGEDYDHQNLEKRYITCYKVENEKTQKAYDEFVQDNKVKEIRHFYHGSKVENWLSIAKQGLLLNPNAAVTGKMFGQGLYFAGENELRKSLNYMDVKNAVWNNGTRDSGYVAVYSVALGKCYKPHNSLGSNFSCRDLKNGCLSVYADKHLIPHLKNDEYIVYRQEQCTIEYLIEMRASAKQMNFKLDRDTIRDEIEKGFSSLVKIPQAFRARFDVNAVSVKCEKALSQYIDFDYDNLYFDYYINKNKIQITAENYDGTVKDITAACNLTHHDFAFLMREMKKAFVESEFEWEKLVDENKNARIGKKIIERPTQKSKNAEQSYTK